MSTRAARGREKRGRVADDRVTCRITTQDGSDKCET
jgi:hypothetical protein